MSTDTIERENDKRIDDLELAMVENLQPIHCPVVHRFTDGLYVREIFMPAGSLITSKIHNTNHPYTISKGKCLVGIDGGDWQEIEAPYTGITLAGTRRVLYILEDCVWSTYHPLENMKLEFNDLEEEQKQAIVDEIENDIIEPHQNYLNALNMHLEYKKNLVKNKIS